jgi:hypothetical protein
MNRWIIVSFLAVPFALSSNPVLLRAQHGHAGGAGMGAGPAQAGGPALAHGRSDGNNGANGAGQGQNHMASSVMSSKNPGGVLDHNAQLSSKLEGLLGLSGPDALSALKADASGFKNFGQFVAAVHVSHNLGIPFADLQSKMTGPNSVSLGKAIQELKPGANGKDEVKKANAEADQDVNDSGS